MKYMTVILMAGITLPFLSEASITRLEAKARAMPKRVRESRSDREALERLLANNKKLTSLLQQRSAEPVVWQRRAKLLTGKTFRGMSLNAINSTNLSSPILVQAYPGQGLPHPTRFACQGVTQNKRVFTLCNVMVSDGEETPVSVQILNSDGSSGLEGLYDDSKDLLIAGAVASEFSAGMLSAAQARISGPLGAISDASVKNQILQGAVNSGRVTSEILLDEMHHQEPVVTVEAGKEVLIYFMEAPHAR